MLSGPFSQSLPKFVVTKIGRRRGATARSARSFHQNRGQVASSSMTGRAHLSSLMTQPVRPYGTPGSPSEFCCRPLRIERSTRLQIGFQLKFDGDMFERFGRYESALARQIVQVLFLL